ncbi:MAG: toxin-antitoxin system HicB family antitoxin [bacterium]|nr:toxin-antitoxin system HicB family antitoxin [bacterium]
MIAQTKVQQDAAEALRIANELKMHDPSWEVFFREIIGMGGVIPKLFPTTESLSEFADTQEYQEIHRMIAELRTAHHSKKKNRDPTRVITVRLPKSLHESLRTEAHEHKTSMNQLCISKLLQTI